MCSVMCESIINRGVLKVTDECDGSLRKSSTHWENLANKKRADFKKHNCSSVIPAHRERELLEIEARNEISIHLRVTEKNNDIKRAIFFIVSCNYFIITDQEKLHLPAEISVCACSMNAGLIKIYSKQLNPQTDLFGSLYLAQAHAQQTHMLPLPPKGLGTTNLKQVYLDIINFMREYSHESWQNSSAIPPLYTKMEKLTFVKSCMRYLHNLTPCQPEILVYPIEYLGEELKTFSGKVTLKGDCKSESCEATFEKEYFEYESEIACPFHESVDRSNFCTQQKVVRWLYSLIGYLRNYFNFDMTPLTHYPKKNRIQSTREIKEDKDYIEYSIDDYIVDGYSSNADCDCSKCNPKEDIDSTKTQNAVTKSMDIVEIINAGNWLQDKPKNKQIVSDKLLTHWNTKAPGNKLLGFGRGHS